MSDSQAQLSQKRYLIGSVLSPAVQLWLRSQAEQVDRLEVQIAGRNRDILNGYIPSIAIFADQVIYRGLHLSQLYIKGENIRINLHQVLKGKQLRLLEPISVNAKLHLNESDFNACLGSELLEDAVCEVLQPLLPYPIRLSSSRLEIRSDRLILRIAEPYPMIVNMGVQLTRHDKIELVNPQLQTTTIPAVSTPLENIAFDLGSDVLIEELTLQDHQLFCRGSIVVQTNEDLPEDL
jgi:hypothetical protein